MKFMRKINYDLLCRCEGFDLMCMYAVILQVLVFLIISAIIPLILLISPILYHLILIHSPLISIHPIFLLINSLTLIINHLSPSPQIHTLILIFTVVPFFILYICYFLHYLLFAKMKSQNFFTDGLFGSNFNTISIYVYSFGLEVEHQGISFL